MKNLTKSAGLLLILMTALILYNCSREVQQFSIISPPFENINVASHEFIIEAETGGSIKLDNGTSISIPPNAFTSKDGNPIKSKVKLKYREFHTSEQILLSGIPMNYKGSFFQTAGMFEINGSTEENETVQIAKNKSLQVNLASNVNDGEYSLYYFDEKKNRWLEKGNSTPIENTEKMKTLATLPTLPDEPIIPQKRDPKTLVFDLDVNLSQYPELKYFNGIVWQFAGLHANNNPEKMPWVFTEKWSNVSLKKIPDSKNLFALSLTSRKNNFSTVVAPVLKEKDYQKAMTSFEDKMLQYDEQVKKREAIEATASREADLLRTFVVNNFGIYNCDRIYQQADVMQITAKFKLDKEVPEAELNTLKVFQLTGKNRTVISYGIYNNMVNLVFDQADNNKLLIALPGNKIAVCSNEDFKSITGRLLPGESREGVFTLHVLDNANQNAESLMATLASL